MSEIGTRIMDAIFVRDELVKIVAEALVCEWTAADCAEEILKRFAVEPLPQHQRVNDTAGQGT